MAKILDIKKYPDKILRTKCAPVEAVDDNIRVLLNDMAFTMHAVNGIGIAAPQVGIDKQIAVVDVAGRPINLINPKIIKKSGKSTIEEGCLSVPEVLQKVKRAQNIKVAAIDENGKEVKIDAEGLLATAIQHEIDHINGVLIIDYAGLIRRKVLKKKLLDKTIRDKDESMQKM